MIRRLLGRALCQVGRFGHRVSTASYYLAAGTFTIDELKDHIRWSWQDFCPDDGQIELGLMPWEQEIVDRFVAPGSDVLLIGCGSGRDVLALAHRGCRVTGVDPADRAVVTAKRVIDERRLSATVIEGFFEDVAVAGSFDAVIFSYYAYTYIPTSRRRMAVLRKASALLKPDGVIVVSYPFHPRPRPALIRMGQIMGALTRSDWRLEAGDAIYQAGGRPPYYSYQHNFEPGEIGREASAAGLPVAFHRDSTPDPILVLRPANASNSSPQNKVAYASSVASSS